MGSSYKIEDTTNGYYVVDALTNDPISNDCHILRQNAELEAIGYIFNNVFEVVADSGDLRIALDRVDDMREFIPQQYR